MIRGLIAAARKKDNRLAPFIGIGGPALVVQGLSEIPLMGDVPPWGVLTVGTGLENACFTNRKLDDKR